MTLTPSLTSLLPENEPIEARADDGTLSTAGQAQVSRLCFRIIDLKHMAAQIQLQEAAATAALVAAMPLQGIDRFITGNHHPRPDGDHSTAFLVEADPNAGWLRPKFTEIPLLSPGDHS